MLQHCQATAPLAAPCHVPSPHPGRNWGGDRKGDEREIMKGEGEKEEQWEEPVNDICQPFTPPL